MATAPAPASTPSNGPSLVIQLGVLAVLTLAAVGTGWFAGSYLRGDAEPAAAAPVQQVQDAPGEAPGDGEEPRSSTNPLVLDLAPVTTNLSAPADTWIRAELSVFFRQPPEPGVMEKLQDDVITYLRTVKLHQIEGPSGFQHLKADLKERADQIAPDAVEAILVRTLLFE